MPIKLITLNIEGHHHLDRFLPFLQQEQPDVVCLQEVFAADAPRIQQTLKMEGMFVPMMRVESENKYNLAPLGEWGVMWLTRLKHGPVTTKRYRGEGEELPVFDENPNAPWRVVVGAMVQHDNQAVRVLTTHFTWSPRGETTPEQRRNWAALLKTIADQRPLVLCGDFNAPRGRELRALMSTEFHDAVPPEIATTLDPQLHYAGPLDLVVDGIFSSPEITVSGVRVVAGVSDHLALVGMIDS